MKKTLLLLCAAFATMTAFAQTNLISNGDFETWTDNTPDNWKSTTTASSATLSKSTDAHSGSYSVEVAGATSANKRLAYKELTLKAGTYTVSFYAKAATAEGASLIPGYVAVIDGKADSSNYKYKQVDGKNSYTTLTNTEWTAIDHTFTLEQQTTINLVIMNSKKPGKNLLVDDYSLTTTDGGVIEDGGGTVDPTPDPDPQPTNAIFSESFAESLGDFTIDDKSLPEGADYIWTWGGKNFGAKASCYINKQKLASESWLISPEIDLTNYKKAALTYDYAANFFNDAATFKAMTAVKVIADGVTTDLDYEVTSTGMSWNFPTVKIDLSAYDGKKIKIAFAYTSTEEVAGTWEIKNLYVTADKMVGITDAVVAPAKTQTIYSLDGRRLTAPVKGINIINGKKVILK